ncbi:SDR family NAD(P)-dependent oxidoreductase [Solimonas terrae]|uniref:SDR family oxidoreductase n=1 Tax=Solimonas terrae TaxID=1396819 RepID=A0A6M2BZ02_9GAMM|nr:glucose 1-dehydrogenase [Solimonas terrae]NGY06987.1 SDR family oxidoreductase [Solimonas terrae]
MSTSPYKALDLGGKVVVVTGGGSGIGESSARLLAARGAAVVVGDIDEAGGLRVVQAIGDEGGKAAFVHTDVSDEAQVRRMVEFAISEFDGLHGALNNAGMSSRGASLIDLAVEQWQTMIDVNLTSVFLCMKWQVRHMLAQGGGSIVNVSSGAGIVGFPNSIDYVASKHGVVGLTRAAAVDFSARGIRINAIVPGGIETPMLLGAMGNDPVVRGAVERGHPIGRLGQPIEIAEAAGWLLSDASTFVTGATVAVDGGYTCM